MLGIFFSCSSKYELVSKLEYKNDSLSVRAIYPEFDKVWFGNAYGKVGYVSFLPKIHSQSIQLLKGNEHEFRSIALDSNYVYYINTGSPAQLIQLNKNDLTSKIIFRDDLKDVFYDTMFINKQGKGIVLGDPIENKFSLLQTIDAGKKWNKITESLPIAMEGEAAFASSNSNVQVFENCIYFISGGKRSRFFKSEDFGFTWKIIDLPIVQGETMTGAYTMNFYNEKLGIVMGGDYNKKEENSKNKCITFDGGNTWNSIAENVMPGYVSCVQFVPNSNGEKVICCGGTGVYYSKNKGKTWEQILPDNDFYTLRFYDKHTLYLAGRKKIIQLKVNL